MTRHIAILAVFCPIAFAACSDPPGVQTQNQSVDAQSTDAVAEANQRVAHAVAQAKIHRDFSEFRVAEKLLTDALADPDATEKAAALQLLRAVKGAAQNEAAAKVAQAPTSSPSKHGSKPVSEATSSQKDVVDPEPQPAGVVQPPDEIVIELEPLSEPVDPAERPAATDGQVSSAVREAQSQFTPEAALEVVNGFADLHQLTEEQRDRIEEQQSLFQERAAQGLVRNGNEWITQEEAKKREADADQKIEQALALIGVRNVKGAIDLLNDASNTDRNAIRPDFALGVIYSTYGFYAAELAERHFQKVLTRLPGHVSALNNLALAELKQKEFGAALAHWKMASEIAPAASEVVHNLGRVVREASIGKLNIEPMLLRRFTNLYAELATGADAPESKAGVGWLYMPLILPKAEQDRPAGEADIKLVSVRSGGTGFVVHEDYIVTNKHVIQHDEYGLCNKVTILDPNDPAKVKQLEAEIVRKAENVDLALLKCPELKVPPVPLKTALPERGSRVLVLGYPWTDVVGPQLKLTQGIVTALPDKSIGQYIVTDAEMNGGNSGGPICDDRGNVIAVATLGFMFREHLGKLGGGIPAAYVHPFLVASIENYQPLEPKKGPSREWSEIDREVGNSVVLISTYYQSATMGLPALAQKGSNYCEDRSCSVCSGLSIVPCPRQNCVGGGVSTPTRVYRETNPINGQKFYTTKYVKSRCPTCGGAAAVSCPACRNGLDPTL